MSQIPKIQVLDDKSFLKHEKEAADRRDPSDNCLDKWLTCYGRFTTVQCEALMLMLTCYVCV